MTLELDFALLLDFAELLEAMLLLDFAELLLDTDEEDLAELLLDFALELDFAELLEATLDDERAELLDRSSPPSAELRAGSAEDDERTELLLDRSSTGAEDDERTELLLASSQSSHTLDEESSPGRTKLLSSSQAAKRKRLAIKNVTPM